MGVEFFPCSRCNESYCDCGEYVTCNFEAGGCERDWCSYECAEEDGYRECSCKLGRDINDCGSSSDECEFGTKTSWGEYECKGCENFIEASCSYCRKEDYEDSDLLGKALELLSLTREDLIKKMKE